MTTSESRGSSTVTSLRLCSRAPATTIDSWRDIRPLSSLRRDPAAKANWCSGGWGALAHDAGLRRSEQPRVLELRPQVGQERVDAQVFAGHAAQQLPRVELAAVAVYP